MAWEWVAPAGTAAVGVVGVLTTFAASRSAQRREERAATRQRAYAVEDALRDERKDVYLRFLTAVDAVDETSPSLEKEAAESAATTLTRLTDELQLVATPLVVERAFTLAEHAVAAAVAKYGPEHQVLVVDATDLQALIDAMAADLRREAARAP